MNTQLPTFVNAISNKPVKKLKTILAILLTLLFSVSGGGVFHYCGGELAGFSLTSAHSEVGCGMEACDLPFEEDISFSSDCCDNHRVLMEVDEYQLASKPEWSLAEQDLLKTFSPLLIIGHPVQLLPGRHFYAHPPDLLHEVKLSVIQVYLI